MTAPPRPHPKPPAQPALAIDGAASADVAATAGLAALRALARHLGRHAALEALQADPSPLSIIVKDSRR